RAPHEHQDVINPHREKDYLQRVAPPVSQNGPEHHFLRASMASVIRNACTVAATSCARNTRTPASAASAVQARTPGSRSAAALPASLPTNDLRETPSSKGLPKLVK